MPAHTRANGRNNTSSNTKDLIVAWAGGEESNHQPVGFHPSRLDEPMEPKDAPITIDANEGHLITFAPTGAGKGTGAIIPALLTYPGSVIVIDPKGENYAVTARRRRDMGQDVFVLDPFGVTGAQSDTFNPLVLIDPDSGEAVDDAALLADLLIQGMVSVRDPFWDQMARGLIQSLILYVATDSPKALQNLQEIHFLLHQSANDMNLTCKDMLRSKNASCKTGANLLLGAEPKVAASIQSTAQSHILFLGSPSLSRNMGATTLDLDGLKAGKPVTIYLVIPPRRLESHGKLLRLWFGMLMNLISSRTARPDMPTLFILDEAAQLGPLSQLRQAVTLLRGYGLCTWSFWQDLSQLKSLYPKDWQTIFNNCRIHQAFGIPTEVAARDICDAIGFHSTTRLKALPRDQMLLSRAGRKPLIARRPDYRRDDVYNGLYDPNPFYRDTEPDRATRADRS